LQPAYVEDVAEAVARVIGRADGSGANSNCMRGVLGSMAYATLTKRRLTPRKVTKSSFKFGLLAGAPALLTHHGFRRSLAIMKAARRKYVGASSARCCGI